MELTTAQFSEIRESLSALEKQDRASEKRRFTRLPVSGKVKLLHPATGQAYTALTRDLSPSGMGIIQARPAQRGDRYVATLPRAGENLVEVACTVVGARPLAEGLYCVHMQFEGVLEVTAPPPEPPDRPLSWGP